MTGPWLALQAAVGLVVLGSHVLIRLAPAQASRLQRILLLAIPLGFLGGAVGPEQRPFEPAAQVWAPADLQEGARISLGAFPAAQLSPALPTLGLGLVLASTLPAAAALAGLARLLRGSRRLRRIRGVEIRISPSTSTPFAVWLGRPVVVLDPDTAFDSELCLLAVRHEIQHHRRRDPLIAWGLLVLGVVSPLALLLRRPFAEAEEIAVDHALLGRGVSPLLYARALFQIASRSPNSPHRAHLAPGMAAFLPRRISMLLTPPPSRPSPAIAGLLALLTLSPAAGWAADGLLADHLPNPDFVRGAVDRLALHGFPAADHASVQAAVTRLVATPEGRRWAIAASDRASAHTAWLASRLAAAGLPEELGAVPFVESGWRNRAESELPTSIPASSRGAGYWMFIQPTARAWGLTVDNTRDDRLDIELETTAALGLLASDYDRYGSWPLALAAYNQGERAVDRAIDNGGTRDVFALADAGHLNDYVAQVYAAALLLVEPGLL